MSAKSILEIAGMDGNYLRTAPCLYPDLLSDLEGIGVMAVDGQWRSLWVDVEVFSEPHWKIMENFIAAAANRGCNMILTPHVTPTLDTARGMECETIQLVDIRKENGKYSFGFDRRERRIHMCQNTGSM